MHEIRVVGHHPDGKAILGYEIEYETDHENWSTYTLADGTRVRIKHTLLKVFRLVDENDQPLFDDNGDPQVYINGSIAVVASKGEPVGEK